MVDKIKKKPINHPESKSLRHVTSMARQSLDPKQYEMFCEIHDELIKNRNLQNPKLNWMG